MWQEDCQVHPYCKIQQIFLGDGIHKGDKLCVICSEQYKSFTLSSSIVPLPQFHNKFEVKKKELLPILKNQADQNIRSYYKKCLGEMEKKFQNLLSKISNLIIQMFDGLKRQEEQYYEFLNKNFDYFSNSELPQLVEIVNENKIEIWNKLKEESLKEVNQLLENITQTITDDVVELTNKLESSFTKITDISLKLGIIDMKDDDKWVKKILLKNYWGRLNQIKCKLYNCYNGKYQLLQDGEMLEIEDQGDILQKAILNGDQLKYLKWQGQKQNGNIKNGKWVAFWKDQELNVGGWYDDKGVKFGKWIEIFENYWDRAQIIYDGEYENGRKINQWNTMYQNKIIGGGFYNKDGLKHGQWKDLPLNFSDDSQIIYVGDYEKGKKVGNWKLKNLVQFCLNENTKFDQIFNNQGLNDDHLTNELNQNFSYNCQAYDQIIYNGGQKSGLQRSYFRESINDQFDGQGHYVGGLKIKFWVEMSKNFSNYSQIICEGLYESGKKQNKWIKKFRQNRSSNFKQIGEGQYQNGIKTGPWIKIHPYYNQLCQITFHGDYENAYKVKEWEIKFNDKRMQIYLFTFVMEEEVYMKMVLNLINGQQYMKNFINSVKLFMKVNINQEKKLDNGTHYLERVPQIHLILLEEVNTIIVDKKKENGQIQMKCFIMIVNRFMNVSIKMEKDQIVLKSNSKIEDLLIFKYQSKILVHLNILFFSLYFKILSTSKTEVDIFFSTTKRFTQYPFIYRKLTKVKMDYFDLMLKLINTKVH